MFENPNKRKAIIVTSAVHALVLILIFFFGFTYLDPPPLKGLQVAYGTDLDAFGIAPANEVKQSTPPKEQPRKVAPQDEKILTQEESPIEIPVDKPKNKPAEKEEKPLVEPQKETPAPPVKEEPKPSETVSSSIASLISAGTDKSKGDGQGTGNKGVETGDPSSSNYGIGGVGGDGNYVLSGRGALNRPQPAYGNSKDEGYIVVKIKVDRDGNVVSAQAGARGTQITDPELYKAAEKAAMATKWQPNPNAEPLQEGYIRYMFRIKG